MPAPNSIPTAGSNPASAFERLLTIMNTLREQCPWVKKQTMETLRHLTIEETYELSDSILEGNIDEIKKELGDIMLHLVFYSRIASETEDFTIVDVLNGICEKLIHRHPHIYSDVIVDNEVLEGVPLSLPALIKASRIQEKARGVGFDWEEKSQVWEKVEEELREFRDEFNTVENTAIDKEKAEAEFGDLLFSLINYARFIDINPEDALEKTNKKFIKRFQYLESKAKELGKSLKDMTLTEMDVFWNEAKNS